MYSRIAEAKSKKNVDILFLGSSHAYRGFDTRLFAKNGLETFNLGSSAQTPIQTKVLVNRYLTNLNPKLVIFEVYPEVFTFDGVESSLDIIANDKNDFSSIKMALELNNIKTYNTLLYGFTSDLLGINDNFNEAVIKGDDKYISGGFVQNKISHYKPTKIGKKSISINPKQLKAFEEIVNIIKAKNIDLLLVNAPIPKAKYNSFTNKKYFDGIMAKHSKYLNFNEIITLNDSTHFYDADHLNQLGVEVFNAKLIEILNNR
jgi:hypothetical protein